MDDGVLIASIADNAGSKASNPPHPAFTNGKVSAINVNLELTRYHVANTDEGLKRKSKAAAAKDGMDGEASIGKFGDGWVIADMMGRKSNFCVVLTQAFG